VRGRIARVVPDDAGGYWVAVHFEMQERNGARPSEEERRRSERTALALPIFVRPAGTAWPEESMTHDLSNNGTRFESSHAYSPGENVIAQIPWQDWASRRQIQGRVVRVESLQNSTNGEAATGRNDGAGSVVAVEWVHPNANAGDAANS
jgi:PilZ domain